MIKSWPTAAVAMVVVVVIGSTVLAGPSLGVDAETITGLLSATGVFGVVVAAWMRGIGHDPTDGGGAIALVIVAAALASTSCAGGYLDVAAPIAQGAQEVQIASEPVIRELRTQAIEIAIREVAEAGGVREEAELARARIERVWRCPIDAHRAYGSATSLFVQSLWLAEQTGEEPPGGDGDGELEIADWLPLARRLVDAYLAIASCANTLEPGQLPEPAFLDLFPASWEVGRV